VTFELKRGEVLGLIGPNGSGKTTTLNMISGAIRPTEGKIFLGNRDITRLLMRHRVRRGVVRTFQSVKVFNRLSVSENIEVAALGSGLSRTDASALVAKVISDLDLGSVAALQADSIPAGMLRKIGIARALAASPKFLLLDEPAAGQNEAEGIELVQTIRHFAQERNLGVLLVEHDMTVVMNTCDRLHVLDSGKTVIEGPPAEVRSNPIVIEIYFGKRH
jgi:branched-chain amino acid transport system ATP-binding protein